MLHLYIVVFRIPDFCSPTTGRHRRRAPAGRRGRARMGLDPAA